MRKKIGDQWFEILTADSVATITEKFAEMFEGKKLVMVDANEGCGFKPEVKTGLILQPIADGKVTSVSMDRNLPTGFNISLGGYTYCFSVSTGTRITSFAFEHDMVTVAHTAPAGHQLFWVFAVQN